MEIRKSVCPWGSWYSHYGRQYGDSFKKVGIKPPHDPAIPLLGIYPEETKTEKVTCTPMFIATLFRIARTWEQPRCQSTDEWIKKLVHIYDEIFSQFSSAAQLCPTLCDPMNHSTPGLPGHHKLLEFTMIYYSAIKRNTFGSVLVRWMNLEPIIQSEVSQKEKDKYLILTHTCMESRKMVRMNLFSEQHRRCRHRKQTYGQRWMERVACNHIN